MVVYAKSNGETLERHTNNLLNRLKTLKDMRALEIIDKIPLRYRDSFWLLIELACKFHDVGKLHVCFQNSMLKRLKKPLLPNQNHIKDVPHNLLSPSFMLDEVSKIQDKNLQDCLLAAVALSHSRRIKEFTLDDRDWKIVIDAITNDLAKRSQELVGFSSQFGVKLSNPPRSNYLRKIQPWKEYEIDNDLKTFYLFLKGFLHRLDYSASGGTEIEIPYQTADNIAVVRNYLTDEKKVPIEAIWQESLAVANMGKNVILQAGTGSGKTEFSLFWAGNRKCFYTLPVRTSVNAMYERIKKTYSSNDVGLLHSDALFYTYGRLRTNNEEAEEYSLKDVYNSRQLSMPITISTADQLFTAVFKYPGFEKIYSTLAYSTLVVDEIQSYDPDMVAVILKGLKDIAQLGGNFCLMTATLPKLYLETIERELKEMGKPIEILPRRFSNINRHRIKICELKITDPESIKLIKTVSKEYPKVLVIVNTVSAAQNLFSSLDDGSVEVSLLHSGFTQNDRHDKEKRILTKEARGIWITTQLVEVSVDIDFPVLVTELSTIDSLVQRMGRIRRHNKEEYSLEKPNVYICIHEPSDRGIVYDSNLSECSKKTLASYDGKIVSPLDEYNMIQEVFTSKEFESSNYRKKFEKSWTLLKDLGFRATSRNEAQYLFRKMNSYTFIPSNIYDENKIEIQKWISEIEEPRKSFDQKLEPIVKLKGLMVSINAHKVKAGFVDEPLGNTGFCIGNLDYNPKLGISTKPGLLGIF